MAIEREDLDGGESVRRTIGFRCSGPVACVFRNPTIMENTFAKGRQPPFKFASSRAKFGDRFGDQRAVGHGGQSDGTKDRYR
jgi:hypothetical protein